MRGQLYHRHTNATALSSSPVVSALGSKSDNPGSSPGRGKALCPWDVQEKKMQAPLLGLAESILRKACIGLCKDGTISFNMFLWFLGKRFSSKLT